MASTEAGRTHLKHILTACLSKLAEAVGIDQPVMLSNRGVGKLRPRATLAEAILVLSVGRILPVPGTDDAGRIHPARIRQLQVTIWSRRETDEAHRDLFWTLADDVGHTDIEEEVFDCLDNYWPEKAGQALAECPIHFIGGSDYQTGPQADETRGWGSSTLTFEVQYSPDLGVNVGYTSSDGADMVADDGAEIMAKLDYEA